MIIDDGRDEGDGRGSDLALTFGGDLSRWRGGKNHVDDVETGAKVIGQ